MESELLLFLREQSLVAFGLQHYLWDNYYTLGGLLKHNSTISHYRSLHSSHRNSTESLPCGFVLSEKLFYLKTVSSRYFQIRAFKYFLNAFLSEIKENLQNLFSLPFFCSSAIARSSVSPRKFCIRRNNIKVNPIETGCIVIADLLR